MAKEYTTIRVSVETKDRLEEHGTMSMTYDDVLEEILDTLNEMEQ